MLSSLSPIDAREKLDSGNAVLVDIREADEFARSHVPGAINQPLSAWEKADLTIHVDRDVIFTCRSGARTQAACNRLSSRVRGDALVLEGGLDAWRKAGLPVEHDAKAPLEIMRQVQIVAGVLILFGVALGFAVSPIWFGLSAFVGAGLTFAGVTGFCGMARLLMLAPWNRGVG